MFWDCTDCIAHQAPLSMGFSRQEYWSGLLFPSLGDLPDPGIDPGSPALQEDSLLTELRTPHINRDFLGGSAVTNPSANAGDTRDIGSIPGSGRSPGEENGNPLQYSCLGNPIDREAWQATVHGVPRVGHNSVLNNNSYSTSLKKRKT